jgi:hypothetical protein
MTEDKGRTVFAFCHLTSVISYLTPETRHPTPLSMKKKIDKINPCFVNYLRDTTIEAISKIVDHAPRLKAGFHVLI